MASMKLNSTMEGLQRSVVSSVGFVGSLPSSISVAAGPQTRGPRRGTAEVVQYLGIATNAWAELNPSQCT